MRNSESPGSPSPDVYDVRVKLRQDNGGTLLLNGHEFLFTPRADVKKGILDQITAYAQQEAHRAIRVLCTRPDLTMEAFTVHEDGEVTDVVQLSEPAAAPAAQAAQGRLGRRLVLAGTAAATATAVVVLALALLGQSNPPSTAARTDGPASPASAPVDRPIAQGPTAAELAEQHARAAATKRKAAHTRAVEERKREKHEALKREHANERERAKLAARKRAAANSAPAPAPQASGPAAAQTTAATVSAPAVTQAAVAHTAAPVSKPAHHSGCFPGDPGC